MQVVVYGNNGERWGVLSPKGVLWRELHIPEDRKEWDIVVFLECEE